MFELFKKKQEIKFVKIIRGKDIFYINKIIYDTIPETVDKASNDALVALSHYTILNGVFIRRGNEDIINMLDNNLGITNDTISRIPKLCKKHR